MIMYSIRARMAGVGPEAAAWAHQIAELVSKKTGVTTEAAARLGGPQDVIWVTRYESFSAFEKAQGQLQGDADYTAMLADARDRNLFDTSTVESAFWQPV